MLWLGILVGAAACLLIYAFAHAQRQLHERRRLLTTLLLELVHHAERFDVCLQAGYGVQMPQADWAWLRYHLVPHLDRGTLALVTSYYAGLEAFWNPRFLDGRALDEETGRLCRDLMERNRRLQDRLERELECVGERRVLGLTVLRDAGRPASPGRRAVAAVSQGPERSRPAS